ncbi:MAG: hypothetical protein MO852_14980 [Candidatus Devosia euplotis]|nr:hypothetical protein [Candidatus Devosia euplotis]
MASCLISAQNPFGSDTARNSVYAALTTQAVNESIRSTDTDLTCAIGPPSGPGVVSLIGGISAQNLDYQAATPTGLATSTPFPLTAGRPAGALASPTKFPNTPCASAPSKMPLLIIPSRVPSMTAQHRPTSPPRNLSNLGHRPALLRLARPGFGQVDKLAGAQ